MAVIVNERDVLLQAASTRFVLPEIGQEQVTGLTTRLGDIEDDVEDLQEDVVSLMNTSGNFSIRASSMTFIGGSSGTSPSTITLTAVKGSGLTGTVAWSVFAGSATIDPETGDSTTVTGSSVTGNSVTIRARITTSTVIHDAFVTLNRLGAIAAEDKINLTNQVTGSLASGNVSGLGALALLNTVNLNTQTTGSLNGQTQVTNLGSLAYANSIAANQIGAGTLAAGVVYAGEINADNITSGTIQGIVFKTLGTSTEVNIGGYGSSIIGRQTRSGTTYNTVAILPTESGGSYFTTRINNRSSPLFRLTDESIGLGTNFPLLEIRNGWVSFKPKPDQAPIRLGVSSSLPFDRSAGSICFNGGWLCFADGSDWYRSDGTKLT